MNAMRRGLLAAALLSAAAPAISWAETAPWPSKPIRIVVAYPGGGVSDTVARALGEKLSVQLATPIVVENKAGASGSIAAAWGSTSCSASAPSHACHDLRPARARRWPTLQSMLTMLR